MNPETAVKSNSGLLEGDKLYLQRAREALPILVRQAEIGQKLYYSDLAEEIGMPNPRNLNYVLGSIGNALIEIGNAWNEKIPPIQCLVLNQNTDLPGEGISWFLDNKDEFLRSPKWKRDIIVQGILQDIYLYPKWQEVLKYLNLNPVDHTFDFNAGSTKKTGGFGTGESESHRFFKEWVFNNPASIGLAMKVAPVQMEYILPSLDAIDVVFHSRDTFIGVEVKSKISAEDDIIRGLFQCIKYDALIRAEQKLESKPLDCRVILVLEGPFPRTLIPMKNQLGVEIIDNIGLKM